MCFKVSGTHAAVIPKKHYITLVFKGFKLVDFEYINRIKLTSDWL